MESLSEDVQIWRWFCALEKESGLVGICERRDAGSVRGQIFGVLHLNRILLLEIRRSP